MVSEILASPITLIVITILGVAFCSRGVGQVAERGQWLHPLAILACITGAAILLIVTAVLFGVHVPLIDSPQAALVTLVMFAILKVGLTQLHHALTQ